MKTPTEILEELCVRVDNRDRNDFVFYHTLVDPTLVSLCELVLAKKKDHPHLNHSTRDEDGDGGWCDDCQTTFEKPTLFTAGYNQALEDVANLFGGGE